MNTLMRFSAAALLSLAFLSCHCNKETTAGPDTTPAPVPVPVPVPVPDTSPLTIQTTQAGALTIYTIDKYNTRIVKIPRISAYLYLKYPTRTPAMVGVDSNYSVVVNSSYYDFTPEGCVHAGFLKINGSICEPMKRDKQLQRLFAYSTATNTAAYFDTTELAMTTGYDLVVQTGPQIIRKSRIDSTSIMSAINGMAPHPRTAFASVNGKDLYVIVALEAVTLIDLGAMLLRSGIFKDGLDVINFDGGPSTVLYVKDHPEFSNSATRNLPMLLCVQ